MGLNPAELVAVVVARCRYSTAGRWVGLLFCAVAALSAGFMALLRWWQPDGSIDVAPDWPAARGTGATVPGDEVAGEGGIALAAGEARAEAAGCRQAG
jgi:hypothetical protein